MGMMRKLAQAYPQTQLWMDSIIPQQIDFGLENACHGVTTAPTVTAFAVKHNQAPWLELAASIHGQHPEYSEQQLLWACMYQVSREQAKKLLPLFHEDSFGMDGHLAIQADIYGFNNAEAMIAQAKVIHSLGPKSPLPRRALPPWRRLRQAATACWPPPAPLSPRWTRRARP